MIKFIVIGTAIAIIATLLWRFSLKKAREGFIQGYPYAKFLDKRLAEKRPELSAEQRQLVFSGLEQYFLLCRDGHPRMVAMPSQVVDDAWHEFILFTRQYNKFCQQAFGRFLHHTPAEAMPTPQIASAGVKRAWRLACARENINPKQPDRLPLIFGIDSRLGIAGGFFYVLDCMAASHLNGSSYCASNIGCGSGCGGSSGSSDSGGDGSSGCGGGCGGGGD